MQWCWRRDHVASINGAFMSPLLLFNRLAACLTDWGMTEPNRCRPDWLTNWTDGRTDKAAAGTKSAMPQPLASCWMENSELFSAFTWTECNVEKSRRRKNMKSKKKTWSYSHTLISGSARLKLDSSPAQHMYCYGVSLSPCVLLTFLFSRLLHSLSLPNSPFDPHFPYFGMSMCYLLTLCMNDNMYVYSYNRVPFSRCWLKIVGMLYRFRFSVHLLFHFRSISDVCRS